MKDDETCRRLVHHLAALGAGVNSGEISTLLRVALNTSDDLRVERFGFPEVRAGTVFREAIEVRLRRDPVPVLILVDVLGAVRDAPERGRALMTHNSNIALMQGDRIAVLGLKGATDLYEYDRPAKRLRRVASPDSAGRELVEDAIAYFHTADRLYRSGAYRATARSA